MIWLPRTESYDQWRQRVSIALRKARVAQAENSIRYLLVKLYQN